MRTAQWTIALVAMGLLAAFWQLPARAEDAPAPAPATEKGNVTVTVTDSAGAAVTGAKVQIMAPKMHKKENGAPAAAPRAEGDHKEPVPVAEGTTDDKGKVTLNDIPVGKYLVRAMLKGTGMGRAPVTIEAGKTAEVALTLKKAEGGHKHGAPEAPAAPAAPAPAPQ
jgi:hypothetical protein